MAAIVAIMDLIEASAWALLAATFALGFAAGYGVRLLSCRLGEP